MPLDAHALSHITDPDEREAMLSVIRVEVARRRRRVALLAQLNEAAAEPEPPASKRCPRCATVKPSSEFGISRTRPDGLQGYCKVCRDRV